MPASCKVPHGMLQRMQSKGGSHLESRGKRNMEALAIGRMNVASCARQMWRKAGSEKCPGMWGDENACSVTDA